MNDRRCAICHAVFTPRANRQRVCLECRPFFRQYRDDEDKARAARYADAKKAKIFLSEFPAAPGCDGCKYWRTIDSGCMSCNYLLDTARKRPCLPGRNCTVRVNKKKGDTK